jgi:hypothetical protein
VGNLATRGDLIFCLERDRSTKEVDTDLNQGISIVDLDLALIFCLI